jgi:hypothetical protein
MKTLVIPDIHQKTKVIEQILAYEKSFDEVVFLGDWFDSFYEPPQVSSFMDTCQFLKELLTEHPHKNKFKFLVGNHDASYIYYNNGFSNENIPEIDGYFCSGFTPEKAKQFRSHFFDKKLQDDFFLKHFKLAHQTQGYTLSHAGIHPKHLRESVSINKLVEEILPKIWENFRNLDYPQNLIFSGAGFARYGNVPVGGLMWLDWREEFETSEDIGRQIVGHTKVKEPSVKYLNSPIESWNIDTEKDYGIILNGRFSTKLIPTKST